MYLSYFLLLIFSFTIYSGLVALSCSAQVQKKIYRRDRITVCRRSPFKKINANLTLKNEERSMCNTKDKKNKQWREQGQKIESSRGQGLSQKRPLFYTLSKD